MLKWLKRWLGWDIDSSLFDFDDLRIKPPRPSAPVSKSPPAPAAPRPAPRAPAPATRTAAPPTRPARKPKERNPLDVLDNPGLTIEKPAADGFDPYNTGAFNRSTSWEKISRQRKR